MAVGWAARALLWTGCALAVLASAGCSGDGAGSGGSRAPSASRAGSSALPLAGQASGAAGAGSASTAIPNADPPPTAPKAPSLPAGMFMPKADLDPNARFDWEETVPGAGGCQPGVYTGTFTCDFLPIDAPADFAPYPISGPLSLTLERSMDGEFLVVADGDLAAEAELIFGLRSKLTGTLDCDSYVLDAMAVDGRWAIGDPNDSLFQGGMFEGDLNGNLDPQSLVLSGNWMLEDPAFGTCDGDWSAAYVP